jgi:antitoxin MazE
MHVSKWGNSLAVRLPQAVVEALKLTRDRRREEALKRLRALRRPLPPGFKFDREEANER